MNPFLFSLAPTLVNIEEDLTMSFVDFPMPIQEPVDNRMQKREDDIVSGDISFFETVKMLAYDVNLFSSLFVANFLKFKIVQFF